MSMGATTSDSDWLVQHHFYEYLDIKKCYEEKIHFFKIQLNFLNKPLF